MKREAITQEFIEAKRQEVLQKLAHPECSELQAISAGNTANHISEFAVLYPDTSKEQFIFKCPGKDVFRHAIPGSRFNPDIPASIENSCAHCALRTDRSNRNNWKAINLS
jgi:hypothetical protein